MRKLDILVERHVWERYEGLEVPDDLDATDDQAVGELFADVQGKPEPDDTGEYDFKATVENVSQVDDVD